MSKTYDLYLVTGAGTDDLEASLRTVLERHRFLELDRADPAEKARAGVVSAGRLEWTDAVDPVLGDGVVRFDVREDAIALSPAQIRVEAERLGRGWLERTQRDVLGGRITGDERPVFEAEAERVLRERAVPRTTVTAVEWDRDRGLVRVEGGSERIGAVVVAVFDDLKLSLLAPLPLRAHLREVPVSAREAVRHAHSDRLAGAGGCSDFAGLFDERPKLTGAALRREFLTWLTWRAAADEDAPDLECVRGLTLRDAVGGQTVTVKRDEPAIAEETIAALRRGLLVEEARFRFRVEGRPYEVTLDACGRHGSPKLPQVLVDSDEAEAEQRDLRRVLDDLVLGLMAGFVEMRLEPARWIEVERRIASWMAREASRHGDEAAERDARRLHRKMDRLLGTEHGAGAEAVQGAVETAIDAMRDGLDEGDSITLEVPGTAPVSLAGRRARRPSAVVA